MRNQLADSAVVVEARESVVLRSVTIGGEKFGQDWLDEQAADEAE